MDYMTIAEAAENWGLSKKRVQVFCASGRIEGVMQIGRVWAIPKDAQRPSDPRRAAKSESGDDE